MIGRMSLFMFMFDLSLSSSVFRLEPLGPSTPSVRVRSPSSIFVSLSLIEMSLGWQDLERNFPPRGHPGSIQQPFDGIIRADLDRPNSHRDPASAHLDDIVDPATLFRCKSLVRIPLASVV